MGTRRDRATLKPNSQGADKVGVRAPLRGGGCVRQGRRTTVGGGRLVGAEAVRWSEVGTGGVDRCVCRGV